MSLTNFLRLTASYKAYDISMIKCFYRESLNLEPMWLANSNVSFDFIL